MEMLLSDSSPATIVALGAILAAILSSVAAICNTAYQSYVTKLGQAKLWESSFISAYEKFWSDSSCLAVRRFILSDSGYEEIRLILKGRNELTSPINDEKTFEKLEMLDKFLSHMSVIDSLSESKPKKYTTIHWDVSHLNYWYAEISKRLEMVAYIKSYWPGLLDPEVRATADTVIVRLK